MAHEFCDPHLNRILDLCIAAEDYSRTRSGVAVTRGEVQARIEELCKAAIEYSEALDACCADATNEDMGTEDEDDGS